MYKHSKQRDLILDYLKGTKAHPTPEQIYQELKHDNPSLGISTVYRNLNTLSLLGLIKKLNVGESMDRFDADMSKHYHFFCEKCNSVTDIFGKHIDVGHMLEDGQTAHSHDFHICGVCASCNEGN